MITLSKSGSSVTFTFDENSGYLQNGTIEVPVNSLSLVIDSSNMATFRKAASNDIFVSARYEEFGMTKAELESWYKDNMVGETGGGGGVDSGTVQTMIDESISGKADTTAVTEAISEAVSGKVDVSVYTAYTAATDERIAEDEEVTAAGINAINDAFTAYTAATDAVLSGKADTTAVTQSIAEATSGKADTTAVTASINAAVSGKVDTSVYTAYTAATDARFAEDELASGEAFNDLNNRVNELSGNAISSGEVQTLINESVSGKQDTLSAGTYVSDVRNISSTQLYVTKNGGSFTTINFPTINGQGIVNKNNNISLVDTSVYTAYTASTDARILEDEEVTAAGLNILNDAFTAYTAATDAVLSGKQDTLSAGTNITISGNVISAEGGGGKAIEAGRGIAITTGATADTVSFNLPISAGTGSKSIIVSDGNSKATGNYTFVGGEKSSATTFWAFAFGANCKATAAAAVSFGYQTHALGGNSFTVGSFTRARNDNEHSSGVYNVSNTGSTTSAQTLFSVGNGTADNARHNAFEIRQNGDIYCSDGTNDVKLQDYLQIKAVKVTQAEYDALVQGGTVDANTLYIITNVVS